MRVNFQQIPLPRPDDLSIPRELSQKQDFYDRQEGEPVRVLWRPVLDYQDMTEYIRAWPDKLTAFVAQRLADDDMRVFARALYEYICQADGDGPAFEEWRRT